MQSIDKIKENILNIKETQYAAAEKHFASFVSLAWNILEPNTELKWNWHHSLISEYLEAVQLGQIKRLIINVPPRSMKSIQVSVCFPAWCWIKEPTKRFMCASYAQTLATKHSVDRRSLIESDWYQYKWNSVFKMSSDQNVKTEFMNNKRGHMLATSMEGSAIGKGGNILIIDDPHDTTSVESDVIRDSTIKNFDLKFTTRLDDKKNDAIIIVMQRLHENDLTGHLLKQGGYEHLKLPAYAKEKTTIIFPISKKEIIRDKDDILHEAREGKKELDNQRLVMGSIGFAGQYDQSPIAQGGNIIKKHLIRHYDVLPDSFDFIGQSWDLSFKGESDNDRVCGTVWGIKGINKYLIDCLKENMDFVQTIKAMQQMREKYPKTNGIYIEEKANGAAAISVLKNKISGIIPINPTKSKIIRLKGVLPQFEAGNVWFPDVNKFKWVLDCEEELVKFPNDEHDDFVDSVSQFLEKFNIAVFNNIKQKPEIKTTIAGGLNSIDW